MDMNDPTNKRIDNALDKFLSPIVYVAIGLGLVVFILVNYWATILILLVIVGAGFVALTQRDAIVAFFKSMYGPGPYIPPPSPRPPENYATQLALALQTALERDGRPLPPTDIFNMALRIGERLVQDETYSLPNALDPHGDTEDDVRTRNVVMEHFGHRTTPYKPVGPETLKAMQEVYPDIATIAGDVVLQSLLAYFRNLPPFGHHPFSTPLASQINVSHMLYEMMQPFFSNEAIKGFDLMPHVRKVFQKNAVAVSQGQDMVWPQKYPGPPEQIPEVYLKGHPFLPLFQVLVPFNPFTDEMRFTHQWCMGDNGSGKTTYLRHLIKHDMERVANDECSLLVMDSKKLIREMRTLKDFGPGQKLDGRLTLIDSDAVFPLNPFYLPKAQGSRILNYMLGSLQDASELQSGALLFYIDAVYASEQRDLYKLRDYLTLKDSEMPKEFSRFDKDTQHWFKHVRPTLHTATSGGIKQRLANFLKEHQDGLARMFNAQSWALNIGELHEGGSVLLVDTNRDVNGKDGAALLGRLIIALIDQLSGRRTNQPGPPLFCIVDEAQDYIANDDIFADILEKARSSKIGMTVAHHHLKQLEARVIASLENTGIKSRCEDVGSVHIKTRRAEFDLAISPLEFEREPQMERLEYKTMREVFRIKYPYKAPKKSGDIEEPKEYK